VETHQRSVKHPNLLIAAAAEAADLTVLHYDEDYDRIAEITDQPTRWLAPAGSLR
jgi:predicted nucleic acid-binding protein